MFTINIFSVGGAKEFDGLSVEKLKNNAPIAGNAERKKSGKGTGKAFCMKPRVKRIFFKKQDPMRERALNFVRHALCRFQKMRGIYDTNHVLASSLKNDFTFLNDRVGFSPTALNISFTNCGL